MPKGFAAKYRFFCLRIRAKNETFPIEFKVEDTGKSESISRAKMTAIAIFAIAQYGTEADGFSEICEEFGEDCVSQLLEIYNQIRGQKFVGSLRDLGSNKPIIKIASHPGLIEDARECNSADAVSRLRA